MTRSIAKIVFFHFVCAVQAQSPSNWMKPPEIGGQLKPYSILPIDAYLRIAGQDYQRARRWMEVSGIGFAAITVLEQPQGALLIHEISNWSNEESALIITKTCYPLAVEQVARLNKELEALPSPDTKSEPLIEGDDFGFLSAESLTAKEFKVAIVTNGTVVVSYRSAVNALLKSVKGGLGLRPKNRK
jgi:hypothetical protein